MDTMVFYHNHADVNLIVLGEEKCEPGHSYNLYDRDHTLMHCILEGKGVFICDGKTYPLQKGQAFIMQKGHEVYYEADMEQPWHYVWMEFSGQAADLFLEKCNLNMAHPIYTAQNPDRLTEAFQKLLQSCRQDPISETSFGRYEAMFHLLDVMVHENVLKHPGSKHPGTIYVETVKLYVQMNLDKKIRITDICRNIGIERTYLYRLFIEETGISPQQYITSEKMKKAKELLESGRKNVSQTALAVGYDDPFAFSKMFTAFYHKSPRNFLKQEQDETH